LSNEVSEIVPNSGLLKNFSPDTLKMADICCYGVRYGKCE